MGVEIAFTTKGTTKAVFLYGGTQSHKEFKRYKGELPAKLSFDDTMAAVRKKLGAPEEQQGVPASATAPQLDTCWL